MSLGSEILTDILRKILFREDIFKEHLYVRYNPKEVVSPYIYDFKERYERWIESLEKRELIALVAEIQKLKKNFSQKKLQNVEIGHLTEAESPLLQSMNRYDYAQPQILQRGVESETRQSVYHIKENNQRKGHFDTQKQEINSKMVNKKRWKIVYSYVGEGGYISSEYGRIVTAIKVFYFDDDYYVVQYIFKHESGQFINRNNVIEDIYSVRVRYYKGYPDYWQNSNKEAIL